MKSKKQFVERLEARIAPALLVNGGNLLGGSGNPTTGETSTGANNVTLVKVLSGQALVFFNNGTITGISVGKNTKLDITGDIAGDIVTNLRPDGRLTDSDNNPSNGEDGGLLLPSAIKGITTHPLTDEKGSIGRIIAGGQIKGVNVAGEIAGIYSGNGIFRDGDLARIDTGVVDFNTVQPGLQHIITIAKGATDPNAKAGISNVTINTARQLEIFSGSGLDNADGNGAAGGDISNVTIAKTLAAEGAKPVVFIHAGDGGAGTDHGGNGGSITSFNDQGSISYVKLQTGNGGNASGTGGTGGSLLTSTIVTSSARYDTLTGNGGNGNQGGQAGDITTLSFTNNVDGGKSLIATDDFNHDGLPDVLLLNTLTGETTVSLGTTTPSHLGEANFQVALQRVTQTDGTTLNTPFLPAEGANPTSLVVSDLNGDGLPDFAVSYASTNSLGIYTNHDAGQFTAARLDLSVSPTRLVAGDFTGQGHADLAIVSASSVVTAQAGVSSQVFVVANDGTGQLTMNPTAAATLPGVATAAAASPVTDDANAATSLGTNLFVGFRSGIVSPVLFRAGAVLPSIPNVTAFSDLSVPITSLDVHSSSSGSLLEAFTRDINVNAEAAGDTTAAPQAEVRVFNLDANATVSNATSFTPSADTTDAHFVADSSLIGALSPGALTIYSNTSASGYTVLTTLGSNGQLRAFATSHENNTYQFAASGAANNRFFFTTGTPGASTGILPFKVSETPFEPRVISFVTGNGGDGDALAGGAGGGIKALTYNQSLAGGVLQAGGSYNTFLTTGHGGTSNGDVGGNGGGIKKDALTLTPAYLTYSDDTTSAFFQTGAGGQGATGGDGGTIKKASSTSDFKQTVGNAVVVDSVAVRMTTGDGGVGTSGAGGKGGGVILAGQAALSGVSFEDQDSLSAGDPALLVQAGNGGAGVTAGGVGGSLTNVGSQNAPFSGGQVVAVNELASALLASGNGGAAGAGNGGAGGTITGTNVTVAKAGLNLYIDNAPLRAFQKDGSVTVLAGSGGLGQGGAGGNGGGINKSTIGSVDGDDFSHYGVFVRSGVGANGDTGGGAGGAIQTVVINSPADTALYAGIVVAGNGGDALGSGTGGAGGSIQSIKQTKDVNSAINVIQAGNGGRGAGDVGGVGGSVQKVNTVGFIGLPASDSAYLGAFHTLPTDTANTIDSQFAYSQVPQGIFAGQGGSGADNGSVQKVSARQIAAIGASVQANGTFAAAKLVSGIKADLIGYQLIRAADGTDDGQFHSQGGIGVSPSTAVPIDGFILASAVSDITTLNDGLTANFTFTN